ncbi:hypothetical protein P872_19575 [Rhodonellum psychrophilum GCM71 = DSM 17998]|uniref:Metallo-beta-lactamase domain-containing protein n=2 Tax=Rhodonellum TaxID=336827 RepID=U5BVW3_9BACT|nr:MULTISPECIES: MBL fold metallo-hydrolase [Rhodonellum]ERM81699.1 hypothetical protein P872_19575 [Rhodonellum psychrophilum GCM71 = DSM 17998]MDO9554774.1 MBL fold metallo-hydrolase [Rhodonellum sp.]SDY83477.1 L-ascorbate metabolism protein UlaG, beta-lactamase superfamily [Rhodonellum ikkaensis]
MKSKKYLFLTLIPIFTLFYFNNPEKEHKMTFISNPELNTISGLNNWKGTPIDEKGNFQNLYQPFKSSFGDLLKWQTSKNPQKKEKKNETRRLSVKVDNDALQGDADYLIWLGHATYLMQINGKVLLTDPVLIDNLFLKRESKLPISLDNLPALDYILLSHSHRDHCDEKTLEYLSEINPGVTFLTGLGMKDVIISWTKGQMIQEAGWYQQFDIPGLDFEITYVPSRHWSRRGLFDENVSLWGGFYLKTNQQSIYLMGDSGSGPHFKDISTALGEPDYCLMGVGAYKPEWFMNQAHISPLDAIDAFNEMGGRYFIPMHFGTFDLSDEPRMEPLDVLIEHESKLEGELLRVVLGKNLLVGK